MNKNTKKTRLSEAGFSLLELLIAVAIFVVVCGTALGLVGRSMPLYSRQQGSAALNIGLRSAVSQIEQDVVNAGTGYYVGINFPNWPVGVTIGKNPAGTCYDSSTGNYSDACFDTLNVLTIDSSTPPGNVTAAVNVLSSNTTVDLKVPTINDPATGSPWTADNYKNKFLNGDQILLLTFDGSSMTTFRLSANATVVTAGAAPNGVIQLTHTPTNLDGTNGNVAQADAIPCTQTTPPANDYLMITMCKSSKLGFSYATNDWALKLNSITYRVDTSTPSNPKLVRRIGASGTADVVADQIVGFKIGAGLWNQWNGCDNYIFDPASYPDTSTDACNTGADPYDFSRIRSVRVSLIGRTKPNTDPGNSFRNTFDGGRYQIQAVSIVINPRNLSMMDP